MIPVCQKTCFSPFHQPLLLPSQAQDKTSGLLPTLDFILIQCLRFGKLQERTRKGHVPRFQCTSQNTRFKSQENQGSLLRNERFLIGRQIADLSWTHLRIYFWLLLDKVMLGTPEMTALLCRDTAKATPNLVLYGHWSPKSCRSSALWLWLSLCLLPFWSDQSGQTSVHFHRVHCMWVGLQVNWSPRNGTVFG